MRNEYCYTVYPKLPMDLTAPWTHPLLHNFCSCLPSHPYRAAVLDSPISHLNRPEDLFSNLRLLINTANSCHIVYNFCPFASQPAICTSHIQAALTRTTQYVATMTRFQVVFAIAIALFSVSNAMFLDLFRRQSDAAVSPSSIGAGPVDVAAHPKVPCTGNGKNKCGSSVDPKESEDPVSSPEFSERCPPYYILKGKFCRLDKGAPKSIDAIVVAPYVYPLKFELVDDMYVKGKPSKKPKCPKLSRPAKKMCLVCDVPTKPEKKGACRLPKKISPHWNYWSKHANNWTLLDLTKKEKEKEKNPLLIRNDFRRLDLYSCFLSCEILAVRLRHSLGYTLESFWAAFT